MSTFGGPRLILTVPGGSSRPNKTSSVKKIKIFKIVTYALLSDHGRPVVKSLGVLFDEYLTFEKQVDMIVKTCNIHLRNLRVIGSKLSYDLKRQLVHCLIFSKLDYCNGLLFGLPDCLVNKLQKVQNSCVRFLFGSKEIHRWD